MEITGGVAQKTQERRGFRSLNLKLYFMCEGEMLPLYCAFKSITGLIYLHCIFFFFNLSFLKCCKCPCCRGDLYLQCLGQ